MAEAFSNVGLLKFLLGLPDLDELGSVALLDLAKDARAEFLKEGQTLHADKYMDRHLFLVEGELEIVSEDQVLQVIKAGSDRAKQTLFRIHTHGFGARCLTPVSLLSLNEETLDRHVSQISTSKSNFTEVKEEYDDEHKEDSIVAEISRAFHHEEVDLPSMPEVALKINHAVQNETLDIQSITNIIQADPMISARAVQVANSAMYAGSQSVQTIKRAVQRIGLRAMRAIVMSVALKNLYTANSTFIKKRMAEYYQHSIRVGVVCQVLTKQIKGFDPEQAFLAGLIHDIGIVPILIKADSHEEIRTNMELLDKLIKKLQTQVGSMLLNQWGFEPELIIAAREAETWDRDIIKADYCDIVQVAQVLCEMIGSKIVGAPTMDDLPAFKRLGLEDMNPKLIVAQAKQEINEVIHLLE
ncbi:MAG: HDOD domain-containing protein [Woeseiaceae bacterium]